MIKYTDKEQELNENTALAINHYIQYIVSDTGVDFARMMKSKRVPDKVFEAMIIMAAKTTSFNQHNYKCQHCKETSGLFWVVPKDAELEGIQGGNINSKIYTCKTHIHKVVKGLKNKECSFFPVG